MSDVSNETMEIFKCIGDGLTADGVTNNMAVNMLGHVLLVDELLSKNNYQEKLQLSYTLAQSLQGESPKFLWSLPSSKQALLKSS